MRKRSIDSIFKLAQQDERVVFIGSDLSPGLLEKMKEQFPNRYFMEGIAEGAIIGMAAGLAMNGFIPYVNTIATFLTRRCYEQIVIDICLQGLPVRLIGNGGGYVYAPLGPTHQAIEDIAIMRAVPEMTVVAACDAEEISRLMECSLKWEKPMYIRLAKGGDEVVSAAERGFQIGKGIVMLDSKNHYPLTTKYQLLFISTGIATTQTFKVAMNLMAEGIHVKHLHIHTIKPLDVELILESAEETNLIVTVEEHSLVGGFGSAVIELLVDHSRKPLPFIKRLGIQDCFAKNYGTQNMLMDQQGLNADKIYACARTLIENLQLERAKLWVT